MTGSDSGITAMTHDAYSESRCLATVVAHTPKGLQVAVKGQQAGCTNAFCFQLNAILLTHSKLQRMILGAFALHLVHEEVIIRITEFGKR